VTRHLPNHPAGSAGPIRVSVGIPALNPGPAPANKGNNEEDKKYYKKNLRNQRSGACNSSKAQNSGDDGDYQEDNGVIQHKEGI
jgi:hypothetical protein